MIILQVHLTFNLLRSTSTYRSLTKCKQPKIKCCFTKEFQIYNFRIFLRIEFNLRLIRIKYKFKITDTRSQNIIEFLNKLSMIRSSVMALLTVNYILLIN